VETILNNLNQINTFLMCTKFTEQVEEILLENNKKTGYLLLEEELNGDINDLVKILKSSHKN